MSNSKIETIGDIRRVFERNGIAQKGDLVDWLLDIAVKLQALEAERDRLALRLEALEKGEKPGRKMMQIDHALLRMPPSELTEEQRKIRRKMQIAVANKRWNDKRANSEAEGSGGQ